MLPTFLQQITDSLETKTPASPWFYIAWEDEKHERFVGAVVVSAREPLEAMKRACDIMRRLVPDASHARVLIKIPETSLPAEEFRNRPLTREEVRKIWPKD